MPGTYPPDGIGPLLRQILQRLRGLETQQQATITNGQGLPVINTGLIPGSNPARYGFQFVNPSTGAEVMFVGVDAAGVPGVFIYDASGNEEVRLGELNASPAIYGLAVAPATGGTPGTLQQVGGTLYGAQVSAIGVTAAGYTAFSPTGSVTAEIGPSGNAYVTLVGRISTGISAEEGRLAVSIDSGDPALTSYPFVAVSESVGAGGVSVSGSTSFVATGLSVGTHTFAPKYRTFNDGTSNCNLTNVQVTVQPL